MALRDIASFTHNNTGELKVINIDGDYEVQWDSGNTTQHLAGEYAVGTPIDNSQPCVMRADDTIPLVRPRFYSANTTYQNRFTSITIPDASIISNFDSFVRDCDYLTNITITGTPSNCLDFSDMFYGVSITTPTLTFDSFIIPASANVNGIAYISTVDVSVIDFSNVTDMSDVLTSYYGTSATINASSATTLNRAFRSALNLTSVTITTSLSLTDTTNMFDGCTALITAPDLVLQNVTLMQSMFYTCSSLQNVPLYNISSATNLTNMFGYCSSLVTFPLINTSHVVTFSQMFQYCTSLVNFPTLDYSSGTALSLMYKGCISVTDVTTPIVCRQDAGVAVNDMFYSCISLPSVPNIDLSPFSTNANEMFRSCTSLVDGDFDMKGLTDFTLMYAGCSSLASIPASFYTRTPFIATNFYTFQGTAVPSVSDLDLPLCNSTGAMFQDCLLLTSVGNITIGGIATLTSMFDNTPLLTSVGVISAPTCATASSMFRDSGIISLPTVIVGDGCAMSSFARGCTSLTDTSRIPKNGVDYTYVFAECSSLITVGDLSFPLNASDNASYMFQDCASLKTVGDVYMPNCDSAYQMFYLCPALVTVGLITLKSVGTRIDNMFYLLTSLKTVKGIVGQIDDSDNAFSGCTALECIGALDTTGLTVDKPTMFANCTSLTAPNTDEQLLISSIGGLVYTNSSCGVVFHWNDSDEVKNIKWNEDYAVKFQWNDDVVYDDVVYTDNLDPLGDGSAVLSYPFDSHKNDIVQGLVSTNDGTSTIVSGAKLIGGVQLSGGRNALNIDTTYQLTQTIPSTVSFWARTQLNPDNGDVNVACTISGDGSALDSWGYQVYLADDGRIGFTITRNLSGESLLYIGHLANGVHTQDTWVHVTATTDGTGSESGMALYINGSSADASGLGQPNIDPQLESDATLRIGARLPLDGTYDDSFNGIIDQFMLFNKVLTPYEVAKLYRMQKSYLLTSTLDPFNDGSLVDGFNMDNNVLNYVSNNNGVASGSLTYTTGNFNNGANLINSQYINLSSIGGIISSDSTTISMWVLRANSSDAYLYMERNTVDRLYQVSIKNSKLTVQARTNTGSLIEVSSVADIPIGVFAHIAISQNFSNVPSQIYINGALDTTFSLPSPSADYASSTVYSGAYYDGSTVVSPSAEIVIDQFMIFNRALIVNEIAQLVDMQQG